MTMIDLIKNRLGLTGREAELFWLLGTFSTDRRKLAERMRCNPDSIERMTKSIQRKIGASRPYEVQVFAHVCVQQKVGPLVPRKGETR